ncbi:MAG: DNA polymerase III subunit alpha [Gloeomargaritaceae cyanobacterium C42_A2020_066]|nr:DNA polymerase III subunit alpha [Gloeomargaritaceae cyanobacterium C42_A2020_066]
MTFVGLHIHSEYSLLDGASQLPQLVSRAAELGMPALALTDHGVMYGAIELIKTCRGRAIKPIIGNEMYVINGDIEKQERRSRYHQVVLAKNTQGYRNLVKLTTLSHLKGVQGKGIFSRPCINKDLLQQYREGLIVTSACLGGEIPQAILQGRPDQARTVACWYQEVFGDDFYLELQDHGSREDRIVNVELVRIAEELGIALIATNDSHFISCLDVEAHDALLCIQTGKKIAEDKRLRYSGTEYLKSAEEMAQLFRDHLPDTVIQTALANTLAVAAKVEPYEILGEPRLPNYDVPPGHTPDTYVEHMAWQGLCQRLQVNRETLDAQYVQYRERLSFELQVIQQRGFSSYFLVVWDYVKYARDNGIPVGPGRGSAAGSLVAYALGITNIDPVHHGLLFERFLNPERKSMPDIDTDFCIENRDKLIQYVTQRYGEDRVAQIITFNRMTSKAALKDVARILEGISHREADTMAKHIPVFRGKPTPLKEMIGEKTPAPEFKERYEKEEHVHRWIDMARRIEGINKTFGVHAAGVVISAEPLDEVVPLQRNNDGAVITQYPMEDIESLGLLKMDFLGLRNLTLLQQSVTWVGRNHGQTVDLDALPLEDSKTYELLGRGDVEGVFQLESSGMRQIVRDLKPSNLEDISSILALYRPGPLDAGLIPIFINRKHGREPIDYAHPVLKPILDETYGVLVYQEQIMKMAQDLAGYSLGQADLLRRAMGKKKPEEMEKQREVFIEGSARNGFPRKLAEDLFTQMVQFAEYCFNKSHSTAYGYITYQTAYLKANYPVEYMAALLSSQIGSQDKLQRYIAVCQGMGIEVEPPDINRSEVDFTPLEHHILFGLMAVRNVGQGAVEHILAARREGGLFQSLADLCDRVDARIVNRRALEALIQCGALDRLHPNRRQLMQDLDPTLEWAQQRAKDRAVGQGDLFSLMGQTASAPTKGEFRTAPQGPAVEDYPPSEKLKMEKELLGFYISDHPLKAAVQAAQILAPVALSSLANQPADKTLSAVVLISAVKQITTKKGDRMAVVQLEDLTGACEAVVFPSAYVTLAPYLQPDTRLVVWGKVDHRDEGVQFILEDVQPLETVQLVTIDLATEQAEDIQRQHDLREVLRQQTGETAKIPVIVAVGQGQEQVRVRLGVQWRVQDARAATQALGRAGFMARPAALVDASPSALTG